MRHQHLSTYLPNVCKYFSRTLSSSTAAHYPRFQWSATSPSFQKFGRYDALFPGSHPSSFQIRSVPDHIRKPDYALTKDGSPAEWSLEIPIYGPEEVEGVRQACKLAKKILEMGGEMCKPGITTEQIDNVLHDAIVSHGAYPSPLNYKGFPRSICTSISNVIAHGIPDSRPLRDGDIINVDITVYLNGFHGDTSATFLVGNVDEKGKHLVNTTKECLEIAIEHCKPGIPFNEVGRVIERHASKAGYTINREFSGHGIGRMFHTLPLILHYENTEDFGEMLPGMIFTVEPMLCQGRADGFLWPDKWTVSTLDGGRSAQWEHTVLITENGVDILTK
ncbi:uncharacterized protein VTP21DRAFT_2010 [Calcarisporiella thermophila]|uniref:uncharacterized protein n=1 Tax=Calcarisporiella thermophila TaxID=911321 RepID=UPI003742C260